MVLICCILVNVSPIRAKALAVETGIAIGIIAALIAAAAGVAFHPQTADDFVAIGNSFSDHMLNWKDESGNVVVSEEWLIGLKIFDQATSGGEDPGDPKDYRVQLARGLLAGISAWCAFIILGLRKVEVEEELTDGWYYYNSIDDATYYLPPLPEGHGTTYPACAIYQSNGYQLVMAQGFPYRSNSGKLQVTGPYVTYQCNDGDIEWEYITGSDAGTSFSVPYNAKWANVTIPFFNGSTNWAVGASPVSSKTGELIPIYVGDIPQQVQDGEMDEEDIPLPLEIDYSKLFENTGTSTAQEAVQKTLEQLSTGQITYDQFMDTIKSEPEIDSGDSGSTEETQPVVDPDVWTPPSDPGAFALDLSEIFPFCIPFDLYDFLTCLNADPVAPVIQWEVPLPGGGAYPLELDLSPFDSVAQLLRRLQLLLFCVALAMKTRDLIKG